MRGLNAGSGQRPFASPWINMDLQAEVVRDGKGYRLEVVGDIVQLPFRDGSMDYVVSHHCLEHLDAHREGPQSIKEAHRVLKVGGSFIVTVPDLRALAQRWMIGQISDYIYFTNLYGAYMGSEHDRHKAGYNYQELARQLRATADWREVKAFDWRAIEGADIAKDFWILGMEAIR